MRAQLPRQGIRGHGGKSGGVSAGVGAALTPADGPVRAHLPVFAPLWAHGHGGYSHGVFGGTGTRAP